MTRDDDNGDNGRPDYKVYRSRPRIFPRLRKRSLTRTKPPKKAGKRRTTRRAPSRRELNDRRAGGEPLPSPRRGPSRRKVVKWILIGIVGWGVVSVLAFGVSAQIQALKLDGSARSALQGNPWLLPQAQNILVIGTDSRSPDTLEPGAAQEQRCYDQQAAGAPPSGGCGAARADTLMVVRAGGGKFNKLSIPRDSYADIPGQGSQKINAAYAYGGAGQYPSRQDQEG